MFRTAILAFIFIAIMLSISFYLVLSADSILDRTMAGVMGNEDIVSKVPEKPSNPPSTMEISYFKK